MSAELPPSTMNPVVEQVARFRRQLHSHPETSGHEYRTAELIRDWLLAASPDMLLTGLGGLGGHGVAAVYNGSKQGPTMLLRAELDGLPIPETSGVSHFSRSPGTSHSCGHDGHMAMLAGTATLLRTNRPKCGRVVLLFQPAEENGMGARAILNDATFDQLRPDMAFALHNLPGYPLGQIFVRSGTFAMGSIGIALKLTGRIAHAAYPESGNSPAPAIAHLIGALNGPLVGSQASSSLITVIHARLGEPSFGTAPGEGVVMATLRSESEQGLDDLKQSVVEMAQRIAAAAGLSLQVEWRDPFPATINDPAYVDIISQHARSLGLDVVSMQSPLRWSEDFGWFLAKSPGVLFGIGAGETQPVLHAPDYDFPDQLLEIGSRFWITLIDRIVGLERIPGPTTASTTEPLSGPTPAQS